MLSNYFRSALQLDWLISVYRVYVFLAPTLSVFSFFLNAFMHFRPSALHLLSLITSAGENTSLSPPRLFKFSLINDAA